MANDSSETAIPPRPPRHAAFGLQARMVVSLILLLSLIMLLVATLEIRRERTNILRQMRTDGIALARGYALGIENSLLLEKTGLSRITGEAGRTEGIAFLQIVDSGAMVIGHTDFHRIGSRVNDSLYRLALTTPITALEKGRTPYTRLRRDGSGREVFCVILPLVILGEVKGALEIGL
jgi:hypothetical protein